MFTIIANPLVLNDQDLKVYLMSSKEEKIAAVQLVENQEGKPLGTSKKNSFEMQSNGTVTTGISAPSVNVVQKFLLFRSQSRTGFLSQVRINAYYIT